MKRRDFLKGLGGGTLGVLLEKILPKPAPEEPEPKEVNHGPFDDEPGFSWENPRLNSGSVAFFVGHGTYTTNRSNNPQFNSLGMQVLDDNSDLLSGSIGISERRINKYRMSDNWHKFVDRNG